jgi:hypothetical protein
MSTRSIIQFSSAQGNIQVYKHWDGYPESTVPELQEFLKWNGNRNNDLDYTVANFCYWHKDKGFKEQKKIHNDLKDFLKGSNTCQHTGLGICSTKLTDPKHAYDEYMAEFMYVVDLDKKIIKELVTAQEWAFEGELIFVEEVC